MNPKQAGAAGAIYGLVLGLIISRGTGILLLCSRGAGVAYLLAKIAREA